jgi:hypothetical protein
MAAHLPSALFDAAVQSAFESGRLKTRSQASLERSHRSASSYALVAADGGLIVRLPLTEVSKLATRRQRRFEALVRLKALKRLPSQERRERFRSLPSQRRLLAWAIACGEPIPPGRMGPRSWVLALLLLALGVLPGLLYLAWAVPRDRRYRQALAALERRWLVAGKPEPSDPAFQFLLRS